MLSQNLLRLTHVRLGCLVLPVTKGQLRFEWNTPIHTSVSSPLILPLASPTMMRETEITKRLAMVYDSNVIDPSIIMTLSYG